MTVYIHDSTKHDVAALLQTPPHALLITGPVGIGFTGIYDSLAKLPAEVTVQVFPEKDERVDIEKGAISVEVIRRLYETVKTVEPRGRVIVIDYAERMGIPAQNAFLKLLEEPSKGTRFVLLTHSPETLLPTILSRVQRIDARPISAKQSEQLLDDHNITDPTRRAQLLFIAKGLPAELNRLIEDEGYFNQRAEIVKDARQVITGTAYQRLLLAKKYKDSRENALLLIADSMRQVQRTLASGGSVDSLQILQRLETVHKRLSEQGNVRLQLSSLIMLQ